MRALLKNILGQTLLLTLLLGLAFNTQAASTWVQGGHAGGWVDPDEGGHGMFVEVIVNPNSPTGLSVVIAWYAYINGQQTWIIGIGQVVQKGKNQVAELQAFTYEGNDFPPLYDPALTREIPWGTMTISFEGCDEALFEYESILPGYGSGEIELERLTTIASSVCDPTLGTDLEKGDDHGNFWQIATDLNVTDIAVFVDQEPGAFEYTSDVDVFMFTIFEESSVFVRTRGDADTFGELFKLESTAEVKITSDDNGGEDLNFRIETDLEPGTYTIHVSPGDTPLTEETNAYLLRLVIQQK